MLRSADDPNARFLYRISVKGTPCLSLPRPDTPEWLEDHIAEAYRTPEGDIRAPSGPAVSIAKGAGIVEGDVRNNSAGIAMQVGSQPRLAENRTCLQNCFE